MLSIIRFIETILRNQFRCKCLRKEKLFQSFFLQFLYLDENMNCLNKKFTLIANVFLILQTRKEALR